MDTPWLWLALLAAFTGGTQDALMKRALMRGELYAVAWLRQLIATVFLAPGLFCIPFPPLDETFFQAFLLALPFEVTAYLLYIQAIRSSPLSLTVPFLSLTPVFLMIIPFFVLGESITWMGAAGIILMALGSYTLHIDKIRHGFLEPLRAVGRERGAVLMIVVALLYAFTNTFGKQAIGHSSALFFGITYNIAFFFALTPVMFALGGLHRPGRPWRMLF
ncbi:MAG: DMT family transporter, partial [Syntrophales bacterium]|nr:DMT family transporter [Syntrophales bacterium]